MSKLGLLLAGLCSYLSSQAEEPVKNFYFAGYEAIFILSDTFRVEVGNPDLGIQKTKDGTLLFTLKDARGSMPKDVVRIYTNDIRRISMVYSKLIIDKPFTLDSLSLSLAAGSNAKVNVKTKCLDVSAGAGSHLTIKGQTDVFTCTTKGHSSINTSKLQAKKKDCQELEVD